MARRNRRHFLALAAAVLLAAASACAATPEPAPALPDPIIGKLSAQVDPAQSKDTLTGQFLVATPNLQDPRFSHAVVFIISHDNTGTMGLVINRAFGEGSLSKLLTGFGVTDHHDTGSTVRLYYGGPVDPARGFVLHSPDYAGPSTRPINPSVSLSTGKDILEAIAAGKGPRKVMFIIGYAGWGAGQLENEIARDDWLTAPVDSSLIFTEHPETTWSEAYRKAGVEL